MISRYLGQQPYLQTWEQMKQFTLARHEGTADELWLLEHPPVYTQGQAGKAEHILNRNAIPIVQSDRGGQVTYHGPGQLVAYVLMDIRRRNLGIRTLVCTLETILIALLQDYGISAETRCGAPGVYVDNKKIASIGLRVKNGCTYHGIALNVAMDLVPFQAINPCGFSQLEMTQVSDYAIHPTVADTAEKFEHIFLGQFEKQGL
ncbi:lipoyl(octanoyl) transferase LipB [Legionella erythra]|uniref:lipoyl(octanoyl) transferase LipB n=1 Tax=Legionella erythra TaxID=448 RepID=UPI0018730B87|nr:lipoyl(octanoyl) transferase LipB [Legionella erythra]